MMMNLTGTRKEDKPYHEKVIQENKITQPLNQKQKNIFCPT
jgi:hypothetical protein